MRHPQPFRRLQRGPHDRDVISGPRPPRRFRSSSPARPPAAYARFHAITVGRDTPIRPAVACPRQRKRRANSAHRWTPGAASRTPTLNSKRRTLQATTSPSRMIEASAGAEGLQRSSGNKEVSLGKRRIRQVAGALVYAARGWTVSCGPVLPVVSSHSQRIHCR